VQESTPAVMSAPGSTVTLMQSPALVATLCIGAHQLGGRTAVRNLFPREPAEEVRNASRRRTLEAQLRRLGVDAVDLWVLRGFIEEQCSVEEAMAVVKARGRCAFSPVVQRCLDMRPCGMPATMMTALLPCRRGRRQQTSSSPLIVRHRNLVMAPYLSLCA